MIQTIIIILALLWFLGYAPITGLSIPNTVLFTLNNHPVTLWEILILLVISWAIGVLPQPFQTITAILLLFWILSVLGILALTGLPNIVVLLIIVALALSIRR